MAVAETGIMAVETVVAANRSAQGVGGIFGCPPCHGNNPYLTESLKLFLPYFPLHIQQLISMYLQLVEFMHIYEMVMNMMNHMDEYQALFKMFEGFAGVSPSQPSESPSANPFASFFENNGFSMPDLNSMQKMMEGSDLVDEFTYVEKSPGTEEYGSEESFSSHQDF